MSDIFISYASEDIKKAKQLTTVLESFGWSVWWDRNIPAGKTWRQVLDEELPKARSVVVLWSQNSLKSRWVLEEAEEGAEREILIPVLIENVCQPRGFRYIQADDLTKWTGKADDDSILKLKKDLSALLGIPMGFRNIQPVDLTKLTGKSDELLDETQRFLDHVPQRKNEAQAKIYIALMQSASDAGRHQDALQYCDKLKNLAGNDTLTINKIAIVYLENAKYKQAESLFKRALEIDEAALGPEHPNVARDLNNLSIVYKDTNRLKEAESLSQRALKINEASFGKDHPKVTKALNSLALVYQATNRHREAISLMERVLKIDEASLGSEHPGVAIDLATLALLYKQTNRLKEAEPLYKRALNINEASFGSEHPEVAHDLNNLAMLYLSTNRLKEAEPLLRRALAIYEKSHGPDHPNTRTVQKNLQNYIST